MSNWKNHAYLFANGKFRVKIEWDDGMIEIVPLYVNSEGQAIADFKKNSGGEIRKYPYKFVGLIARKISDMTGEEWRNIVGYSKGGLREAIRNDDLKFYVVRYLLSIGVYPFDDDTDVIFKPKTEQP